MLQPRHDGKRHLMVPGGPTFAEATARQAPHGGKRHVMEVIKTNILQHNSLNFKINWRTDRGNEWNSAKAAGERCGWCN